MPKLAKKKAALSVGRKAIARGPTPASLTPMGADIGFEPEVQLKRARAAKPGRSTAALDIHSGPEVMDRLWDIIDSRRAADPAVSHSARLLGRGTAKVAQKFGEEAVECLIEVVTGNRAGAVEESADVLYHLLVMWVEAGIRPEEVWATLENREAASNLTNGPKGPLRRLIKAVQLGTTKIP